MEREMNDDCVQVARLWFGPAAGFARMQRLELTFDDYRLASNQSLDRITTSAERRQA